MVKKKVKLREIKKLWKEEEKRRSRQKRAEVDRKMQKLQKKAEVDRKTYVGRKWLKSIGKRKSRQNMD